MDTQIENEMSQPDQAISTAVEQIRKAERQAIRDWHVAQYEDHQKMAICYRRGGNDSEALAALSRADVHKWSADHIGARK